MFHTTPRRVARPLPSVVLLAAVLALVCPAARSEPLATLPGHIPARAIAAARALGPLGATAGIDLAIVLRPSNQPALDALIHRLYDPYDPLYGKYLTPDEFSVRFGPTPADYQAVAAFAGANGLTVVATHRNRLVLDVHGPSAAVERAFHVRLMRYQTASGRVFHAPDREPQAPAATASRIAGIVGLENVGIWRPHNRAIPPEMFPLVSGWQIGTGPGAGLTPSDIQAAYGLKGLTADGSGQVLGLFELAGYSASDISAYESYYGLRAVPLTNIAVDGGSGSGGGADEVTLDIELQIAGAPGAAEIRVYEGPNSITGVIDTYNAIATENRAKSISTSWGLSETQSSSSMLNAENTIFQQMAAQGQSIYAAAGDSGAYDNGSTLSVDDPASQPYVSGVGGTRLTTNGAGGSWSSETTWNSGSISAGAGGGGVSAVWPIPSYQSPIATSSWASSSKGSTTKRNVPDVALDADPNTGYSIYYRGGWWIFGGTSCGSPLWSAFNARVNQQRAANGLGALGFPNPALYGVGTGGSYGSDFHDVKDGSTNLYYPAITGFDDATGWGSFNGANLLVDLSGQPTPPSPPAPPTNLKATAGDSQVSLTWTASSGATSYNIYRSTSSGAEVTYHTGVTSTSFNDTTVTNGTTYYYVVTAMNSAGESGYSNEASATPQASTAVAPPTGLLARGAKRKVNLSWTQSTGANITRNRVYRSTTSGGGYSLLADIPASTGFSDTTAASRKTYYYVVTAVNSSNTESAYSNEASAAAR